MSDLNQLWADEMNRKVEKGTYSKALKALYPDIGVVGIEKNKSYEERISDLQSRIRELEAEVERLKLNISEIVRSDTRQMEKDADTIDRLKQRPDPFDILTIRCMRHRSIPQLNTNENGKGECGACIAEELATLKHTIVSVIGGVDYEGIPTSEINYLQRLRILLEKESSNTLLREMLTKAKEIIGWDLDYIEMTDWERGRRKAWMETCAAALRGDDEHR